MTRLAVALVALLPGLAFGQAPSFPIDRGAVDAVFKDYGRTTPGCALGLYERGKVVYAKGYGMADLNLDVPITPQTVFDIGSTSKQFAAASVLLLANEGKIALTDDVRKYIPELRDYGTTITIDHMLRHTSGLRDYNGLLYMAGHYFEDVTTDEDALAVIVSQRALNFVPGSEFDYSNTGFFLLSVIVKRVTGQTLAAFAKARLFEPLGMPITHFRDDHAAILKDRATAYGPAGKDAFAVDMSSWDQTGDGAVNTTVLELAKWDANFYDAKVGGRALMDRLQERGTLTKGDTIDYARGLFVDRYRGLRRVHHGGAWAGYRAMLMRFPEQGIAVGLLCNVANANTQKRAEDVADVVLAKAFPEAKAAAAARSVGAAPAAPLKATDAEVAAIIGRFLSKDEQSGLIVAASADGVTLTSTNGTFPIERASGGHWTALEGIVALDVAIGGQALSLSVRGRVTGTFARVAATEPTAAERAAYAGTYPSPELGTTWTVRVDGDTLRVAGRAVGESALQPLARDTFLGQGQFVQFTRGSDGAVHGFELTASRMRKIRFDRKP